MSTLQVANIWFESTQNNGIQYLGTNNYSFIAAGSNAMYITQSAVSFGCAIVETSRTVATNYTISTGKSAMSVGPLTINSGVVITIPSGSKWVVL
jgi:hypothetical protein